VDVVKSHSRQVAIAVVCCSLLAIGILDYFTAQELSFSFFYLVSVAISVILLGRLAGVLCSLGASGIALLEQWGEHVPMNIALWNSGMRLATLLLATFILHRWWTNRQEGYTLREAPRPQPPGGAEMLKRMLGTIGLVYIPFAAIVVSEYWVRVHIRLEISLGFFYLLPLMAAVAMTRRKGGLIYSILASTAFLLVQHYIRGYSWGASVWNASMRLAILLTIAQTLWSATNATPRQPDPE
jgi:hypothetical protein